MSANQDRTGGPKVRRGPRGRLTPEQVRRVRELAASGASDATAGAAVGVTKSMARRIRLRERYAHIQDKDS